MTKNEIAKQVLSTTGGIAKTADFLNVGLDIDYCSNYNMACFILYPGGFIWTLD
ncbi:MAG: hypothetical protein M0P01_11245 [Treponema sp.]|nr:hypothetical protein [Treponema sp.]